MLKKRKGVSQSAVALRFPFAETEGHTLKHENSIRPDVHMLHPYTLCMVHAWIQWVGVIFPFAESLAQLFMQLLVEEYICIFRLWSVYSDYPTVKWYCKMQIPFRKTHFCLIKYYLIYDFKGSPTASSAKGFISAIFFESQLSFGGIPLPGKPGTFLRKNFHGCMENLYYNGINIIDLAKRRKPQIHSVVRNRFCQFSCCMCFQWVSCLLTCIQSTFTVRCVRFLGCNLKSMS